MEPHWKGFMGLLALVTLTALVLGVYQTVRIGRLERALSRHGSRLRADSGEEGAGDTALSRRVAALEQTAMRLLSIVLSSRRRAETGEGAALGSGRESAIKGRLGRLRKDVDAILSNDALSTEEGRKRLHQLVEEAQQKTRQKVADRWRELFEHRMRKALKVFADQTGMTEDQLQKLTQLAYSAIDESNAIRQSYQRGEVTPSRYIEQNKKVMEEMDKKVRVLLGEETFKKYVEARKLFFGHRP